ncbi:hypothetical protein BDR07DRAFT_1424363 [Suillus spraguei]|nr:hypothetical protein BDR07DRAFT_1424363 [Suillus spraguei]
MRKRRSSRDSTQETRASSQAATARESPHRPRKFFCRGLENWVEDDMYNLWTSRLKDPRSRSPVPPISIKNVLHRPGTLRWVLVFDLHSLYSLNAGGPQLQAAPSGVEMEADTQSALQDAQEHDTYLEPLRIFNKVISEIGDVHPYAKMALSVLSCAAKVILAQVGRDAAVLKLLENCVKSTVSLHKTRWSAK